jgi:hypothetical protein
LLKLGGVDERIINDAEQVLISRKIRKLMLNIMLATFISALIEVLAFFSALI